MRKHDCQVLEEVDVVLHAYAMTVRALKVCVLPQICEKVPT